MMTWQVNILWMVAILVLVLSNLNDMLPPGRSGRDFWLTILPVALFGMAQGLRQSSQTALGEVKESRVKRGKLWRPRPSSWVKALEAVSMFLVAFPFLIALGSDGVDRRQFGINLGAFVMLMALWVSIRNVNEKTAQVLEDYEQRIPRI